MKKFTISAAALIAALASTAAFAKVNYTSIGGEQYCCDSVGPSGYAAQGCTKNPGGAPCAAKIVVKAGTPIVAINRTGQVTATRVATETPVRKD